MMKVAVLFCAIIGFSAATSDIPASNVKGRIIGGTNAYIGQINYMASLRNLDNEHFCGGWIHNSRWIVSAAQCTVDRTIDDTYAVVGTMYRTRGGYNVALGLIINHPRFNRVTHEHDISLLMSLVDMNFEPARPFPLSPYPMESDHYATISGWGETTNSMNSGPLSSYLKTAVVWTIKNAECQQAYGQWSIIGGGKLCTSTSTGRGTNRGDQGGPLVTADGVVGIILIEEAPMWSQTMPDVYTRISNYFYWIQDIAGYT